MGRMINRCDQQQLPAGCLILPSKLLQQILGCAPSVKIYSLILFVRLDEEIFYHSVDFNSSKDGL